jgi:hypothetical protein
VLGIAWKLGPAVIGHDGASPILMVADQLDDLAPVKMSCSRKLAVGKLLDDSVMGFGACMRVSLQTHLRIG